MTKRQAIFPANRHALYEEHGYSAAIRSGDLLFVSGQVGSRNDGTPEPDFERQVQLAFDNLKAILDAAGCTFDDVMDVTTFHTDPENQFAAVQAVRQRNFTQTPLSLSETQSGWQVKSNQAMLLVDERCLQPDLVGADRIVPVASVAAGRDLDASSSA